MSVLLVVESMSLQCLDLLPSGLEEGIGAHETYLQGAAICGVDAGNGMQVLWKNLKCY